MELFKGYVLTKNKRSIEKIKDRYDFKSYDEVKDKSEYAGVLADDTILIDVDDVENSNKLLKVIEDQQLKCRVYETTRGKHFLFKNPNLVTKCSTGKNLACGIPCDIKIGTKNSYEVLKFNGVERKIIKDYIDIDNVPKFLTSINNSMDFINMTKGDGRNQSLFNYILTLQANGFSKDEARQTIRILNDYVLKEPLSKRELEVILRDEAFKKELFFEDKKFLHHKFAEFLKNNNYIVRINNVLHIYNEGIYTPNTKLIERKMIEHIPNLKAMQRKEVIKYLDIIVEDKNIKLDANLIAFKNCIYDVVNGKTIDFSPHIVITNKINHNYNPNSYSKLADDTLDKLSCGDRGIRNLLEEMIGYCFYRRNELGKAFILTGDKSNGKSTFLAVIRELLGENNISSLDLKELGDRFSSSMMFGKLANIGDDIGDDFLCGSQVSMFKKIVTGDRVKVERKGEDPFEFNPTIKLLFSANTIPRIKDKTGAVLRRLVIIPFKASFSKKDPSYDPFIKYKLIEEEPLEYFITLGIKGLRRVLADNQFTEVEAVQREIKDYEMDNNPILLFLNELDDNEIVNERSNDVYLRYDLFCNENGFKPMSKIGFTRTVCNEMGYKTVDKRIDGKKHRVFEKI